MGTQTAKIKLGRITALLFWVIWAMLVFGVAKWAIGDENIFVYIIFAAFGVALPIFIRQFIELGQDSRGYAPETGVMAGLLVFIDWISEGPTGDGGDWGGDGGGDGGGE